MDDPRRAKGVRGRLLTPLSRERSERAKKANRAMTNTGRTSGGNWTGRAILVIVLWVVLAGGAYLIYSLVAGGGSDKPGPTPTANADAPAATQTPESTDRVKVGIAYGTEKKRWLTAAVEAFNQTPDGKKYEIDLIPMGSVEGAQAVVNGDERIDVWSPASAMYREAFEADWSAQHGSGKPILREETLALSPMVFVFWDERYTAFHDKLGDATFPDHRRRRQRPDRVAGHRRQGRLGLLQVRPHPPRQEQQRPDDPRAHGLRLRRQVRRPRQRRRADARVPGVPGQDRAQRPRSDRLDRHPDARLRAEGAERVRRDHGVRERGDGLSGKR